MAKKNASALKKKKKKSSLTQKPKKVAKKRKLQKKKQASKPRLQKKKKAKKKKKVKLLLKPKKKTSSRKKPLVRVRLKKKKTLKKKTLSQKKPTRKKKSGFKLRNLFARPASTKKTKLKKKVKKPRLKLSLFSQVVSERKEQTEKPPQTVEPTQALVPVEKTVPAAVVTETTQSERAPKNELSTEDFVHPNEELRLSIEGFLLDQRSPHTRKAYAKDLKRFVKYLLERKMNRGIESIRRTLLISYKESLLSEGLEHTTVDRHLATLRSFFGWLVDDGVLEKNPAQGVRFMNPKRLSRTRGFTDAEVQKVLLLPDLHTRTGSQHYAILMILFYCGLRRSEICELRTKHIGMERNQHLLRLRGKGNKERIVVLVPAVWHSIRHYLIIARRTLEVDDYLFKPIRNNRTGVLKKALDPSMIFYIVTRYAKLAGIEERVSPHSCRATAISNARDHNVPDRAIQEFAGWASPDMITRYDKRRTSIQNSAGFAITYGEQQRKIPEAIELPRPEKGGAESSEATEKPKGRSKEQDDL